MRGIEGRVVEFAEWVVSGLEQLRIGQLPGGGGFYQAVSAGIEGDSALNTFMNSGDPAARAELVQAIARAVAADPGFEQRLRDAAGAAQGGGPAVAGRPSFLKTAKGKLALVAAVVVVGGGIGLGVGLSGSGSGSGSGGSGFADAMKGAWNCEDIGGDGKLVIGDGTWSSGGEKGTWSQQGGKAILTLDSAPGVAYTLTNVPSGAGTIDITLRTSSKEDNSTVTAHVQGSVSEHSLAMAMLFPDGDVKPPPPLICKK